MREPPSSSPSPSPPPSFTLRQLVCRETKQRLSVHFFLMRVLLSLSPPFRFSTAFLCISPPQTACHGSTEDIFSSECSVASSAAAPLLLLLGVSAMPEQQQQLQQQLQLSSHVSSFGAARQHANVFLPRQNSPIFFLENAQSPRSHAPQLSAHVCRYIY